MYTYDIRTSGSVELKHRSWLSMYRVTFSFHFPLLPYLVSSYVSRISRVDIFREENIFVYFFSLGLLVYIASKYSIYVVRFFFLFFLLLTWISFEFRSIRVCLFSFAPWNILLWISFQLFKPRYRCCSISFSLCDQPSLRSWHALSISPATRCF